MNVGLVGSSPGGDCWICKDLHAKDPFTTGCGHTYCRTCIVEYVRKVVKSQMAVLNPTYPDLMAQLMCPNSRCFTCLIYFLSSRDGLQFLNRNDFVMKNSWFNSCYEPVILSVISCVYAKLRFAIL